MSPSKASRTEAYYWRFPEILVAMLVIVHHKLQHLSGLKAAVAHLVKGAVAVGQI